MLTRISVKGFKSLHNVKVHFPRLTVLFGPNTAGKSNLLDAIQALSRIGTNRTLSEALTESIRGYPVEQFAFPAGGLPALYNQSEAAFTLEADLEIGKERYRYRVNVKIQPGSGSLTVQDEFLTSIGIRGDEKGIPPIQRMDGQLRIHRKSKPGHPRQEPIGLSHSLLSDPRLGGAEYRAVERCRTELSGWRAYYLDPRVAMRKARPPAEVTDIGVLGEDIAPFLYRLHAEKPKLFEAVKRTLRSLIPSVDDLSVDLDKRRGTLDILIRQDGLDFPSRIVSEGTLRVLALCAIAVNPWGGALIAFEEPENGVHPRRLELIAQLFLALSSSDRSRQLVVTTHSAFFCDMILKHAASKPENIALLNVRRTQEGSTIAPFQTTGPLFKDHELAKALSSPAEDVLFENLMLRGLLDE
jgi:predicted ATPase